MVTIIVVGLICLLVGYLLGFYVSPVKVEEIEVPVEKIVEKVVYVDKQNKPKKKKSVSTEEES